MTELADRPTTEPARRARRLGGVEVNELLTSSAAALLSILLIAEGITILNMRGLRGPHMFIGLMLIPPIALKLASTGYRFARYYTGAPVYVAKGPPQLALRALAPLLVATTVMIFVTGVWLLILGHHSDQVLMLHKVAFIVWSGVFGVHFLAHLPRAGRSLRAAWGQARRTGPARPDAGHGGARRGVALRRVRARARAAPAHRRLAPRLRLLSVSSPRVTSLADAVGQDDDSGERVGPPPARRGVRARRRAGRLRRARRRRG